jgi:hypothetical protein
MLVLLAELNHWLRPIQHQKPKLLLLTVLKKDQTPIKLMPMIVKDLKNNAQKMLVDGTITLQP